MARKSGLVYVNIAPCVPLCSHGREEYTYYTHADAEVVKGTVVRIPFGKRTITGVVTHVGGEKPRYPTKQIIKISPFALTSLQMNYAAWIAKVAHGGLGYTLRLF